MEEYLDNAIRYVAENCTWSNAEENLALNIIEKRRCGLDYASPDIYNAIYDLMEEYSADNDLPEEWWLEYTDVDEIFYNL